MDALQRYLRHAVMNRIRDECRQTHRRPSSTVIDSKHPDMAPSPLDRAINAQMVASYDEALARLRADDRDAIVDASNST